MDRRILIAFGVVLLIGLGIASWLLFSPAADKEFKPEAPRFTITAYDRSMGNPKAPVVLIEYGAPICPHCANFAITGFPLLKSGYINTGKVFYVFRVYPLRPEDGAAEKLARCMPAEKYFDFVDLLFRNQPKWDSAEYPGAMDAHAGLLLMARIVGMSDAQAEKCMADTGPDDTINRIAHEGEQQYNISATPTFVINGVAAPAGEEWAGLQPKIDAELARKGF